MDATRALTLLTTLADGIHPFTGEVFSPDSPYQHAEIVRALYVAVRVLEEDSRRVPPAAASTERAAGKRVTRDALADAPPAVTKGNAGKPWSTEEERELLERFDAGVLPGELARLHGRSVAGIEARLEKLGRLRPDQRTTSSRYPMSRSASQNSNPV